MNWHKQGLGIPIVTLLLEGGKDAIRIVKDRLREGIACVAIEGSGRCQFHQHFMSTFYIWKCLTQIFSNHSFGFFNFCQKNKRAKAARKMLVKLTKGLPTSSATPTRTPSRTARKTDCCCCWCCYCCCCYW